MIREQIGQTGYRNWVWQIRFASFISPEDYDKLINTIIFIEEQ